MYAGAEQPVVHGRHSKLGKMIMKQLFLIAAALFAGFVGGMFGTRVSRTSERPSPEQVVRAHKFELVDETGKVISFWGVDRDNYAVLAIGSYWPKGYGPGGPTNSPPGVENPRNQRARLGVAGDSPFLDLRGSDGETRMMVNLSIYDKPIIWMADETGRRLFLGVQQSDTPGRDDNNWALSFEPERASIGMFAGEEGGQKYVQGWLSVSRDKLKFSYQPPK